MTSKGRWVRLEKEPALLESLNVFLKELFYLFQAWMNKSQCTEKGFCKRAGSHYLILGKNLRIPQCCDRENLALLRCTKYTATSVPEREGGIVHLCGCTTDGIFSLQIHLQPIFLVTIRYCCPLSGGNFLPALSNPLKRWGAITQPGNGCEFHL